VALRSKRVSDQERARLVRATRALASAERNDFHRGGPLVLGTISQRLELLERIARLLEDRNREVDPAGLVDLARLVDETPPVRDYGLPARERNERIAMILAELGDDK
jgi:hypothetical protein